MDFVTWFTSRNWNSHSGEILMYHRIALQIWFGGTIFDLLECRLRNFVLHAWLNNELNKPGFVCDAGTFRTGIKECAKVQKILEPHKEKRRTGRWTNQDKVSA